MKKETTTGILWATAIAAVVYLFKGEQYTGMAIIILAALGFSNIALLKKN